VKPTPLRRFKPSRRLMREYGQMTQLADWLRAVAGWAAVVAIAGMAGVGFLGN
jgi:hypothetical protein